MGGLDEPGTREDKCHGEDGSRRMGSDQINGEGIEDEGCARAIDSDRSWENQVSAYLSDGISLGTRQEIIGGILRQLRNLQAAHLAYVKAHKERLEVRLTESEKHQNKIAQEMEALERVIVKLLEFEASNAKEEEGEE